MDKIVIAEIISNHEIACGIFKMLLRLPDDYPCPDPGEFINIYLNDKSRLLPRPISVCDWEEGVLTLVYAIAGSGTKILSDYGCGVKIRISTPLGNGFLTEGTESGILVGGGVGVPPLLFLAKHLTGRVPVRVILGFRSEPFLADEFPCKAEIATDDGSAGYKGNVMDLLGMQEIPTDTKIFACGPKPMLTALAWFAKESGLALQVSLEERMGCGYGACVGCVCKTIAGNRKICEDGPVFDGAEVVWDE